MRHATYVAAAQLPWGQGRTEQGGGHTHACQESGGGNGGGFGLGLLPTGPQPPCLLEVENVQRMRLATLSTSNSIVVSVWMRDARERVWPTLMAGHQLPGSWHFTDTPESMNQPSTT